MFRILKWTASIVVVLMTCLAIYGYFFVRSLDLASLPKANIKAGPETVGYRDPLPPPTRGRILAVVSSTSKLLDGSVTGFELTELSRAWWVFRANGYMVDIASPLGGEAPMRLDDLIDADYAFLNQPDAQAQMRTTLKLAQLNGADYQAIYFVGGKGTMLDFPKHPEIARLLRDIAPRGVIGAVCHGPAALLQVELASGERLLSGHTVAGFSNLEERLLTKQPEQRLGFLLQNALENEAAIYSEGTMYLEHVVVSDRIVTGQNPWSTWAVAEAMVRALGHEPVARTRTAEERSVELLALYRKNGYRDAVALKSSIGVLDRRLLIMHSMVAGMQWQPLTAFELAELARP